MVSEEFVLWMTWGCGFVMPCRRKLSSLVEFVSESKSFKNRKRLDKVMWLHTHDYIKGCFSFLNSNGLGKEGWQTKGLVVCRWWIVALYVVVCPITPQCFVSGVCSDEGMQIQGQLDLLTITRIGRAYETISYLQDVKM